MKTIKVKLTFQEEALGTTASDPEIHEKFIASKAPDAASREEEVAELGAQEVVEKSMTVFPLDENGDLFVWDYQIKGFFKDSCGMLARAKGTLSSNLSAFRKIIDGLIFVFPRKIKLQLPEGSETGECQRPLLAKTPQGERVALAHSKTVPPGTQMDFEIKYYDLKSKHKKEVSKNKDGNRIETLVDRSSNLTRCIREWLDYGASRGLLQWRNSGKGRFTWEELE